MKKLLTLISAIGMGATGLTGALNVASCSKKDSKDDAKSTDIVLKANNVINVTIKGESATLFSDEAKDGTINGKLTVSAKAKSLANVKDDKKALDVALKSDAVKAAIVEGIKTSEVKKLLVEALKKDATLAKVNESDITTSLDLSSLISDKAIGDIDIPNGEYGIEKSKPWILKDDKSNQKDVDRYSNYILKNANKKIDDTGKTELLTLDNTEVVFSTTFDVKTGVPASATLKAKKDQNISGSADVTFTLLQNIQPSGFDVAKNAKDKAKFIATDAKPGDKDPGTATLEIIKGKSIAIIDNNIDITKWSVDTDFTVGDISVVAAGDADDGLGLVATGAVGTSTTINFINPGFKHFSITVNIVDTLSNFK